MGKLKKEIRESYFNSLILLFPALVFVVIDRIFEQGYCLGITCAVTVGVAIYVYRNYEDLFRWYLSLTSVFLGAVCLMGLGTLLVDVPVLSQVIDKLIFLIFLTVFYFFRKPVERMSDKLVGPFLPMSNNIAELFRIVRDFMILAAGYLLLYIVFTLVDNSRTELYIHILNYVYVGILIVICVFCTVRVRIVRLQLLKERWLPIITREGKVVGTVQRVSSLSDKKKYMHPVVRGILVNEGRVLLQRPVSDDLFYNPEWEIFLTDHVNLGEKADDSLKRIARDWYGIEDLKSMLLTKYIVETPFEKQYVIVFAIGGFSGELQPNAKLIHQVKWWTTSQIEQNLNAGIFSANFLKEYELLKRSGLLDSDDYDCSCDPDVDLECLNDEV